MSDRVVDDGDGGDGGAQPIRHALTDHNHQQTAGDPVDDGIEGSFGSASLNSGRLRRSAIASVDRPARQHRCALPIPRRSSSGPPPAQIRAARRRR
jgi:hypothetical protein